MRKRQRTATDAPVVPPRSLYRKIQIVLAEARASETESIDALIQKIEGRGHLDFTRYEVGKDQKVRVVGCSHGTIEHAIDICAYLELLELRGTGSTKLVKLTPMGRRATDPKYFNQVVRQAITDALSRSGVSVQRIRQAIGEIFSQCQTDMLPTWDNICRTIGTSIRPKDFHEYLTLLGAVQGIAYTRKKIYLPR